MVWLDATSRVWCHPMRVYDAAWFASRQQGLPKMPPDASMRSRLDCIPPEVPASCSLTLLVLSM